jgi:hypothetical protein
VRTGDDPNGDLASFPVATSGALTGTDQLVLPAPVTTRYVLVWVTGLVQTAQGFTGSLAEVTPQAAG